MRRKPYVAGYFYPGDRISLLAMLEEMSLGEQDKKNARAVIAPHAGYIYSGRVAGAVYSSVNIPRTIILLGPSHRPIRSRFAVYHEGTWETPLGSVPVCRELADLILEKSELVQPDCKAHEMEHSLEVQLPFIQFFRKDCEIVPISNTYFASLEELQALGIVIAEAISQYPGEVLIVASTDMSHQVDQKTAKHLDFIAINAILKLDEAALYHSVEKHRISMCGFQATTAALAAAKRINAEQAELILYQTSGDATGDMESVVGYAGIRII